MTRSRLDEMETFAAVAAAGSFSEAARGLGLSPSAVSKLATRLEQRLGVRLVNRTTHGLSLTAEGLRYAQACRRILETIEEAEADVSKDAPALRGPLRISSSGPFAFHVVAPLLQSFRERHPLIRPELLISDSLVDLIEERADLALRIGPLKDSTLRARPLGKARMIHVAAPSYLRRRGEPEGLDGLAGHDLLGFAASRMAAHEASITTDSGEMLRHLALQGLGIACLADFHVAGDLAEGCLVEILAGATADAFQEITAVFPAHRQPAPRVAAFIDHLASAKASNL